MEDVQKKLQDEIENIKQVQIEYQKTLAKRQQLDSQLNENTFVKEELDLLKSDNDVFKLIGPVLVKQELDEAKENINKRIEFISAEIERVEKLITSLNKKQEKHTESIMKLRSTFCLLKLAENKKAKV